MPPLVDGWSPASKLLSTTRAVFACFIKRSWGSTNDPNYGDVHFYTYSEDVFDPEIYPRAKFVSEWGFMSLPSFPGKWRSAQLE